MIARGALVTVLNTALGAVLGLVSFNFVTAYAGDQTLGVWVYAMALLGVILIVTGLGFTHAHIRHVSGGKDEATANGTFLAVKLSLTGIFVVLSLAAFYVVTRVFHLRETDVTLSVIVIALLYHAASSVRQCFDFSFQGRRLFVVAESVLLVDTLVTVTATTTAALVVGRLNGHHPLPFSAWPDFVIGLFDLVGPLPPERAALLIGGAALTGKTLSLLYSGSQFFFHRFKVGRPSLDMLRSYWRYGSTLAIVSILLIVYQQIDRVMLGLFWQPQDVAHFEAAWRPTYTAVLMGGAVGTVLFPTASHHQAVNDAAALRKILAEAERYLSLFLMGGAMLAVVYAPEAIRVLTSNPSFDPAIPILVLMVPFMYFTSLYGPARAALLGFDRTRVLLKVGLLNLVLIVGLNLVAIPADIRRLGIPLLGLKGVGAAGVASLAAVASYVYLRRAAREWVPQTWLPSGFWRQLAAAATAGGASYLAKTALGPRAIDHAHELALAGGLGFALYLGLLYLLKGFTREDVAKLLEILHPPRFARYVGDELGRSGQPKPPPPPEPPRFGLK